jgi:hypothetical protein
MALDAPNNDSLDELLLCLGREGFTLPYSASVRDHRGDPKSLVEADQKAWRDNRNALLTALTKSGWAAG